MFQLKTFLHPHLFLEASELTFSLLRLDTYVFTSYNISSLPLTSKYLVNFNFNFLKKKKIYNLLK